MELEPSSITAPPATAAELTTSSLRSGFRRLLRSSHPLAPRLERTRWLKTPAADDGFDFTVAVSLVWMGAPRMAVETLRRHVEHHEATLWETVDTAVRVLAHRHAADRPSELEQELVDLFQKTAADWQPATKQAEGVRWRARLRVEPHERVKTLRQDFFVERLNQDHISSFGHEQVGDLRKLVAQWRLFLADLNLDDPAQPPNQVLAPHLARLAVNPGEAAQTVAALQEDRWVLVERLQATVREAMTGHQRLNTYEFVMSYESALKLLLEHLGTAQAALGRDHGDGRGAPA